MYNTPMILENKRSSAVSSSSYSYANARISIPDSEISTPSATAQNSTLLTDVTISRFIDYSARLARYQANGKGRFYSLRDDKRDHISKAMSTAFTGRTPLTNLYIAVDKYPSRIAFKIPVLDPRDSRQVKKWQEITYSQFLQDVESFASYWSKVLLKDGIAPRSVVTFFLNGYTYIDILHIYGIFRAGYIPQPMSIVPTALFILPLLEHSKSKALIFELPYAATVKELAQTLGIRTYDALTCLPDYSGQITLPSLPEAKPEDIAIFFHTSGSTSGKPKIVPGNYRWLDAMVTKLIEGMKGSFCHTGQFITTIRHIGSGSTIVQPLDSSNSIPDLVDKLLLPGQVGITQIYTFPVALMHLIRRAQKDESVRKALVELDAVGYGGGSLPVEDEHWASANGINLVNVFASTECAGISMISDGSRYSPHNGLHPVKGTHYRFQPIASESELSPDEGILELVVPPDSSDCPHPSLRSADGLFYTGDLFREISDAPGYYVNCGRDDDWIKMENAARCDTRSIIDVRCASDSTIEDEVRSACQDLISECVVVGRYRPKPVLFVEPLAAWAGFEEVRSESEILDLRSRIYERIRDLHEHRYESERITGPDMIVVVPQKSLPRTETKGNIRRALVEEEYHTTLELIFGHR
ncbi:hypothetical protein D9758_015474 [Tetrapyrgos nigripes]|uniref:AMP-dependent synthetase/ligase domain-containing protein n=1 Tax=Tetrapyrgos nigripes TaxID=182062 RepID=A0A8H5CME5_9AGAR|nr:hypothetical protein D9758_015474 [Tetrapyrgos nigripes]